MRGVFRTIPVFYDEAFTRVKSQKLLTFFTDTHPHEDKAYQYQFVQRFFREYTYVKHIPDFDSLQLSQKNQFQIHSITKNLFRLNIFAIYFPLKLIFFTVRTFSIRTFSLDQVKVIFAFIERIDVDHSYHKCTIEY